MRNKNEQFMRAYKKIEVAAVAVAGRKNEGAVCWLLNSYLKGSDVLMMRDCMVIADAIRNANDDCLFEVSDKMITFLHKTYRDIAVDTGCAGDIMIGAETLRPAKESETLYAAARHFIRGCEYLPVLSDTGTLVTVITKTDVMGMFIEGEEDRGLGDILKEKPGLKMNNYALVTKEDAAAHAKKRMEKEDLSCILVSDFGDPTGKYWGIITRDCL